MAPADGRPQRLVPLQRAPAAPGQQPEAVVQPLQHLLGRQGPQPPRRQLQGQRDPVEPAAQLPGVGAAVLGQPEVGAHPGGPLGEQPERVLVGHGRERVDGLARQLQRQPARRQDPQPRGAAQQLPYQRGALVHQVLEAVDHQQEAAVGAVLHDRRAGRPGGVVGEPQRLGHGVFQQTGVVDGGQLHQPHPVAVPFLQKRRGSGDQAGLADPAHPGHGHEPGLVEGAGESGQFALPAHEVVQLGGQIARVRILRASHETRRVLA